MSEISMHHFTPNLSNLPPHPTATLASPTSVTSKHLSSLTSLNPLATAAASLSPTPTQRDRSTASNLGHAATTASSPLHPTPLALERSRRRRLWKITFSTEEIRVSSVKEDRERTQTPTRTGGLAQQDGAPRETGTARVWGWHSPHKRGPPWEAEAGTQNLIVPEEAATPAESPDPSTISTREVTLALARGHEDEIKGLRCGLSRRFSLSRRCRAPRRTIRIVITAQATLSF
ncbi:uncharacterized protein A4U43_C03F16090 [Asparagus officinalis]|uniref:Uncharacterized protein n=1 Tax=Asparagus officinalis TaxID=4686 RepID=A0A5P1FDB7_ASPOF|nr:uncharacterized protein A4U43_C03F16090 [Asparagus officinalis]